MIKNWLGIILGALALLLLGTHCVYPYYTDYCEAQEKYRIASEKASEYANRVYTVNAVTLDQADVNRLGGSMELIEIVNKLSGEYPKTLTITYSRQNNSSWLSWYRAKKGDWLLLNKVSPKNDLSDFVNYLEPWISEEYRKRNNIQ